MAAIGVPIENIRNVQLQRRHYEFLAAVLRDFLRQEGVQILFADQLVDHFATFLQYTNPSFNRSRFIEAAKRGL